MSLRGVWTVAATQGKELLRRRLAVALLILLPVAWYLSIPADDPFGVTAGAFGVAFAAAGASFFSVLAWRRVDPRLALAGSRPLEQVVGRLLLLETLALTVSVLFFPLLVARSGIERPALLALGLLLTATIGLAIGFAIAQIIARELEGTLALIAVVGLQIGMPPESALSPYLPLHGPPELVRMSGGPGGDVWPLVLHALAYLVGLFAVSLVAWTRRVRVIRWDTVARAGS